MPLRSLRVHPEVRGRHPLPSPSFLQLFTAVPHDVLDRRDVCNGSEVRGWGPRTPPPSQAALPTPMVSPPVVPELGLYVFPGSEVRGRGVMPCSSPPPLQLFPPPYVESTGIVPPELQLLSTSPRRSGHHTSCEVERASATTGPACPRGIKCGAQFLARFPNVAVGRSFCFGLATIHINSTKRNRLSTQRRADKFWGYCIATLLARIVNAKTDRSRFM